MSASSINGTVITVDLTLYCPWPKGRTPDWLRYLKRGDPALVKFEGAPSATDLLAIDDLRASGLAVELIN